MSDIITQIALGGTHVIPQADNLSWRYKFGATNVLGSADTNEMIWNGGGDYTGFPAETETLSIASDDAGDDGDLTIQGLDADYNEIEETVTLNGTTPVLTTLEFHRAPRAYISSGSINAGDVTINHSTTTANVMAVMPATYGQTQICAFTVPKNRNCLIKSINIRLSRLSGAAGSAQVSFRVREFGETDFRARAVGTMTSSSVNNAYAGGILLPEKTDIKVMIEDISDNSSYFTGQIEYILLDD